MQLHLRSSRALMGTSCTQLTGVHVTSVSMPTQMPAVLVYFWPAARSEGLLSQNAQPAPMCGPVPDLALGLHSPPLDHRLCCHVQGGLTNSLSGALRSMA